MQFQQWGFIQVQLYPESLTLHFTSSLLAHYGKLQGSKTKLVLKGH